MSIPLGGGGGSGFANPMTTVGDLISGGASGAASRLASGAEKQVLATGALVLQDSFVDTNGVNLTAHAMNQGPGWTSYATDACTIQSNSANFNTATLGNNNVYASDAGKSNVTVTCNITVTGTFNVADCGLVVRMQDTNNYWLARIKASDSAIEIWEKLSGTLTLKATSGLSLSIGNHAVYQLKVVASGTNITVYLNGFQVVTFSSTDFQTATKCGIFENAAAANASIFNNFATTSNVPTWQTPSFTADYAKIDVTNPPLGFSALVGDNFTDNLAAMNSLIAAYPNGAWFDFPIGKYKFSGRVDFSTMSFVKLTGHGWVSGSSLGSYLYGGTANDSFIYYLHSGGGRMIMEDLNVQATAANCNAIYSDQSIGSIFRDCEISSSSGNGLVADHNCFNCNYRGLALNGVGSGICKIGLMVDSGGGTSISGCNSSAWTDGFRLAGEGTSMTGNRSETCGTALNIGQNLAGSNIGMLALDVCGMEFEANDVCINAHAMGWSHIRNCEGLGSTNAPSGQSKIGIVINFAQKCTFANCLMNGGFNDATWRIAPSQDGLALMGCVANTNTFSGAKTWDMQDSLLNVSFDKFCNYNLRATDGIANPNIQDNLCVRTCQQVNWISDTAQGKNLCGSISLGNLVTTVAFLFTADHSISNNTVSLTATTGGSLTPGQTYYYAPALFTAHGGSAALQEYSVTLGGAQNAVSVQFHGQTPDGFRNRLYRGTTSGVYDGYYERPLNDTSTFLDTGAAFTGRGDYPGGVPSLGADDSSMIEPDANYIVICTPTWGTTVAVPVSSIATTGFTVNFGTPTPDANQKLFYMILRGHCVR